MSNRKLILNEWLARERAWEQIAEEKSDDDGEVEARVRAALADLEEDEREFIAQYYYMGRQEAQIAEASGRAIHRVRAVHDRAIRKLRAALGPFVANRWGVDVDSVAVGCPVCESGCRAEIDRLIAERDRTATWRPVMRAIRERFGIEVHSPHVLIGHERYH